MGLIDVGVRRVANEQALQPLRDSCVAKLNGAAAIEDTPSLQYHGECDPFAELTNLLGPPLDVGVGTAPVLKEAAYGCLTLEDAHPPRRRVPDCVWSVEAEGRLDVLGLDASAYQRNQIGGRGLLKHRSIALRGVGTPRTEPAPHCTNAGTIV
jgi:hypothetical protein